MVVVFSEENLTMLAPLPSIEAFRRDAVSRDAVDLDDGVVARWLESATRLERAAMTRGEQRERLLGGLLLMHGVVMFPDSPVSTTALVAAVTELAGDMADQACFRLSHSVLSTLLLLVPDSEVLLKGRVMALQGRDARQLGDYAAASHYYGEVERLGNEYALPELLGRAWLAQGILARLRGAFPEARRLLNSVVELSGVADESVAIAHQELLVAAATAGDYDAATSHAWKAFKGSTTASQETEALLNLSQLMLDMGYPRAALRGFAAAMVRKPIPRLEMPILGGAACAAAVALPDAPARALVRNFAERLQGIVRAVGMRSLSWPSASALVELSEALAMVGDEQRSEEAASEARVIAEKYGYHQLTYRLENPVHVATAATATPVSSSTNDIIAAIDELGGAELVGAAG